jgi:hypothetical protein
LLIFYKNSPKKIFKKLSQKSRKIVKNYCIYMVDCNKILKGGLSVLKPMLKEIFQYKSQEGKFHQ